MFGVNQAINNFVGYQRMDNQPSNQPDNQPENQSVNQPDNPPVNQPDHLPDNWPDNQPIYQSISHSTSQLPVNQLGTTPVMQLYICLTLKYNVLTSMLPVNQSVESINSSINQLISQPTNRSINLSRIQSVGPQHMQCAVLKKFKCNSANLVNQLISQPTNQSVIQSPHNQSITHSLTQSILIIIHLRQWADNFRGVRCSTSQLHDAVQVVVPNMCYLVMWK